MRSIFYRRIFTVIALYCVIFTQTACDPKTITTAKEQSSKVATAANEGVNIARELYRNSLISPEMAKQIADGFIKLANSGIAFDLAVKKAELAYGSNVPKDQIAALFNTFDAEVIGSFLAVLQTFKLIGNTTLWSATIETIKVAVLIVAKAFNRKAQVQLKLATV